MADLGRAVRKKWAPRSYYAWGSNEGTGKEAGLHYNLWAIGSLNVLSN